MVTVESFCGCRNGGASGEVVPPHPPLPWPQQGKALSLPLLLPLTTTGLERDGERGERWGERW